MTTPPYLQKGDTIGIVCASGFIAPDKIESCVHAFKEWGFNIKNGSTTQGNSDNYFSGTDAERLLDLQLMLDDKNIKAIFFARGGYGITRIIDKLDFKKFRKNPKWLIGFSDITILHSHVNSKCKITTLHAPMANAFNSMNETKVYINSLKNALQGLPSEYSFASHPFNIQGKCYGNLIGGNLAMIAHSIGSVSEPDTDNKILMLEDVGEYLYNIDRMMFQLYRSGKLKKLKGLIFGSFTELKDTERKFGITIDELLQQFTNKLQCPVCFHFPVGHGKENVALKIGGKYELDVSDNKVLLKEI